MTETLVEEREDNAYADAMKLIDDTMRDISGTSITSSNVIIDVLLDIRGYIDQIVSSTN